MGGVCRGRGFHNQDNTYIPYAGRCSYTLCEGGGVHDQTIHTYVHKMYVYEHIVPTLLRIIIMAELQSKVLVHIHTRCKQLQYIYALYERLWAWSGKLKSLFNSWSWKNDMNTSHYHGKQTVLSHIEHLHWRYCTYSIWQDTYECGGLFATALCGWRWWWLWQLPVG